MHKSHELFIKALKLINDDLEKRIEKLEIKNRELEAENRSFKRKRCYNCGMEGKSSNEKDPVMKICVEKDPFLMLAKSAPHCLELMLNHLEDKDVYNLSRVSKHWKNVIENDKKSVEKLKNVQFLKELNVQMSEEEIQNVLIRAGEIITNSVDFEHAKVSSRPLYLYCLIKSSETLKSIELMHKYEDEFYYKGSQQHPFGNFCYPKLEKLVIDSTIWIEKCNFPSLKEIKFYHHNLYYQDFLSRVLKDIENELCGMPKLERLKFVSSDVKDESCYIFSRTKKDPENDTLNLESAELELYIHEFPSKFPSSLRKLQLISCFMMKFNEILCDLKNLHVLTIHYFESYEDELISFNTNTSIKEFELHFSKIDLLPILRALPSLEILKIYKKLNFDDLSLIARNLQNLKKLICFGLEENALKEFEALKRIAIDNEKFNQNFEVVVDSRYELALSKGKLSRF